MRVIIVMKVRTIEEMMVSCMIAIDIKHLMVNYLLVKLFIPQIILLILNFLFFNHPIKHNHSLLSF